MKKCECCGQEKDSFPFEGDDVCEDCCNSLLLGSPSQSVDWSQFDFEKGDWK